jgi:hypothetical protein
LRFAAIMRNTGRHCVFSSRRKRLRFKFSSAPKLDTKQICLTMTRSGGQKSFKLNPGNATYSQPESFGPAHLALSKEAAPVLLTADTIPLVSAIS